nr:MAG TPA: hypothetical protein [Caudoviricetes sp.]
MQGWFDFTLKMLYIMHIHPFCNACFSLFYL